MSALDSLRDPIVIIADWRTDAGAVVYVNAAWTGLTGYTAAEVLGRPAADVVFGDGANPIEFDLLKRTVSAGKRHRTESFRPRKNAPHVPVLLRASALRLAADGDDYLLVAQLPARRGGGTGPVAPTDGCTILSFGGPNGTADAANKRLAEEVVSAQLRYQNSLDACPFGVERIDTAGRLLYGNPIYHQLLGFDENELIGETIFKRLRDPRHSRALEGYLRHVFDTQPTPTPVFTTYRRKNGREIDLRLDWTYDRNSTGSVTGLISVVTPKSDPSMAPHRPKTDAPPAGSSNRGAFGKSPSTDDLSGRLVLRQTLHAARVWASILSHRHPEGDDAQIVAKVDNAIDEALRMLGADRRPLVAASRYYEQTTPLAGLVIAVVEPVVILRRSLVDLLKSWGCHAIAVERPEHTVETLVKAGRLPDMIVIDLADAIGLEGNSVVKALWQRYGPGIPAALIADEVAPEIEKFAETVGMKIIRRPVHPIELRSTMLALRRTAQKQKK